MAQATLIGDIVASRQADDRAALQEYLLAMLASVGERIGVVPVVTLGDEFQARYEDVATAVAASWFLHLGSVGWCRLRIGIGWGDIVVEGADDSPFGQDGPAWWRARDAIGALEDPSLPLRTLVSTNTDRDGLINSYLYFRDLTLEGFDDSDASIVLGLTDGNTQRSMAERLGIHESSVSRRVSRRHLASLITHATPDFEVGE